MLISLENTKPAAGFQSAVNILIASIYYLLLHKIFKRNLSKTSIEITLFNRSATVFIFDKSDIVIFNQIFANIEYNFITADSPETIIDLGSNNGYTSVFFKLKYPESNVYAFEPVESTFNKLLQNTKSFRSSVNINQKAVSDKNGEVQMNVNTRTSVSSSLYERTNDSYVIFTVKSITLDRVLEFYDIEFVDLIKFDIEGAEDLVFSSFTCWDSVEVIVGEAHYDLMDTSRLEFLNYFEEFDVTVLSKYREDREILQFDHR